ncbi:hypothetical protein [Limnoglobus roseus]|uniref:Uncharacterized protein n=1 Tax=Limnoglobus roseus TaxID=2598579 RepID=A0A5C1AC94_9BACT|nr:hypothetical protein [Limnoglobus roseus]QEL14648.1 hypothetical protein PX52LOC_01541 [Limnoglobus roseus]
MRDEPDVRLVLRVLPDPQAAHGTPDRDGDYRLKLLLKIALRQLGLKCVSLADVRADTAGRIEGGRKGGCDDG